MVAVCSHALKEWAVVTTALLVVTLRLFMTLSNVLLHVRDSRAAIHVTTLALKSVVKCAPRSVWKSSRTLLLSFLAAM